MNGYRCGDRSRPHVRCHARYEQRPTVRQVLSTTVCHDGLYTLYLLFKNIIPNYSSMMVRSSARTNIVYQSLYHLSVFKSLDLNPQNAIPVHSVFTSLFFCFYLACFQFRSRAVVVGSIVRSLCSIRISIERNCRNGSWHGSRPAVPLYRRNGVGKVKRGYGSPFSNR